MLVAAPATLRRLVMPALKSFEFLPEAVATRRYTVAECIDVDAGGAEFKRLEQASGVAYALWGDPGAGLWASAWSHGRRCPSGPAASTARAKSTNVR